MALTEPEVNIVNRSLDRIGATTFTFGVTTSNEYLKANRNFATARNALLRKYEWAFARTRLRLVAGWLTATVYTTDQYVWQSAILYKCSEAHTSDTFTTDLAAVKWVQVSATPDWATSTAYALGAIVVEAAVLYQCIVAHTSGTFSTDLAAGKWKITTTKPVNIFGYSYDIPSSSLRLVENQTVNNTNRNWNWWGEYTYPRSNRPSNTWVLEANTILTDDTEIDIVYINTVTDTTEWDSLFTELFVATFAKMLLAPLSGSGPGAASLRDDLNRDIFNLTGDAETVTKQEGNNTGSSDWNNARFY